MTPRAAWMVATVACLALTLWVWVLLRGGFAGISNDDAARTLIAADFARHPSLDPTRSSWLPVPTYLLGLVLRAGVPILAAARTVSFVAGCACCVLAAWLCRAAGARPVGALVAVLAAALWRWSVLTSAAPGVAEMMGVAFLLAGSLALARESEVGRWTTVVAGISLGLACGCRYEAWFAAPVIVGGVALGARRRRAAALAGAIALVVPLAWLAMNAARRGDPLEFVHRVERFRHDEGLTAWPMRLVRQPRLAVREVGLLALLAAVGLRSSRAKLPWVLAASALGVLLALTYTELRGGGASHHPARALLPVAWLLVPAAATGFDALWYCGIPRRALGLLAAMALTTTIAFGYPLAQSSVAPESVAVGREVARTLREHPDALWLVELARQDFLWVELASERPARCIPDRVYGAPAPTVDGLVALARRATVAAVSTDAAASALKAVGYALRARRGAWRVMERSNIDVESTYTR